MENQNISVENLKIVKNEIETQNIISLNKFIFLSIISFGTYKVWWTYKSWKFFKQKDDLDINPIARTIFTLFFINSLFNEITDYSMEKNYEKSYSSSFLTLGYIITIFLGKLPEPYWLISLLSFIFLIPPFKALNFSKINSTEFKVIKQDKFNSRQIVLIVLGIIFWSLVILGMTIENK